MAKKRKPPPVTHIRVCEVCGEPFETKEVDRTSCVECPTHNPPHADPAWKTEDEPGWSNAIRHMEDKDQ